MTGPSVPSPPASWYNDPAGSNAERWWDGQSWTETTRPRGSADSDDNPPPREPAQRQKRRTSFKLMMMGVGSLGVMVLAIVVKFIGVALEGPVERVPRDRVNDFDPDSSMQRFEWESLVNFIIGLSAMAAIAMLASAAVFWVIEQTRSSKSR